MGEWKEYKLGDLFDKSNQGVNTTTEKVKYSESGIPVIRAKNIHAYKIDFDDITYVKESTFQDLKPTVKPVINDVLYTNIGSQLGNAALVKSSGDFLIAWNVFRITPIEKLLHPIFLVYLFNNPETKEFIENLDSSSTMPFVSGGVLRTLEFLIPPLSEQKDIASVLSSLDDKIDLLHRQNKTLEAMAETLFRQWFVDSEYSCTVSDLIEIQNGYAFKSKDFKDVGVNGVIKIKNISGSIVDINNGDFIEESLANKIDSRFVIETGDILFAMTGAKIGKMGIIPQTERKLWLNQRVGLLREKYNGSRFLAYLQLKSDYGQDYIGNTATGSAQPNISSSGIVNCDFPMISKEQIINYSKQLSPLFAKTIFNLGQIRTLEKLRDTLLPKLMSGEVRVEYKN